MPPARWRTSWNTRRYVVRYAEHPVGVWNIAEAWNIAVRTRGVFTHRAVFQKPACAERGLVRTANQPVSVNYDYLLIVLLLKFCV